MHATSTNGSAQFHKLHKTTSMSTHFQHHAHSLSDPTHLLSDPTHLNDVETNVFVEGEENDES